MRGVHQTDRREEARRGGVVGDDQDRVGALFDAARATRTMIAGDAVISAAISPSREGLVVSRAGRSRNGVIIQVPLELGRGTCHNATDAERLAFIDTLLSHRLNFDA